MLNITNHEGNANQSCSEIPFHTHYYGYCNQKRKQDVEKLEHSYTAGWEHKMVQLLWKKIWWFLKKLELPNGPTFPLSINPREMKVCIQQDMFKNAYSSIILNS